MHGSLNMADALAYRRSAGSQLSIGDNGKDIHSSILTVHTLFLLDSDGLRAGTIDYIVTIYGYYGCTATYRGTCS